MDLRTTFPRRLSGADDLMWRIEADPVLRSPILVVGLLDREPRDEDVRHSLASWQMQFPRLRQRLVAAPRLFGGARWVDCEHPSLDFHLRRVRAPHPADLRTVLALAEPTVTAPFDPARPLWELTLVDGLVGDRAALLLRFHHTVTDGVGGVALAGRLFDHSRDSRRRVPRLQPAAAGSKPRRTVGTTALRLASGVARGGLDFARHPVASLDRGRRLGASLAMALAPGQPGSPLFSGRGLDRHLSVVEAPLAAFQRAAGQLDCTVNDVYLAAIGGALRKYHDRLGQPVAVLQCTMPINLRRADDPHGGNRFAPARFALPIDDPDPAARARIARAIARRWRAEPALAWTGAIAATLDALPGQMATRLLGSMLKGVDVDAVNVAGLRRPAYFARAEVERLWAFSPPTGAALSVTLLSHVDTCCIALQCDRRAVRQPEVLQACLVSSLDEMLHVATTETPMGRTA